MEDGIFNDSWRIRQSSVELLGDLLFKVHFLFHFLLSGFALLLSNIYVCIHIIYFSFFKNSFVGCWNIRKSTS